jgi:hypothetical protein
MNKPAAIFWNSERLEQAMLNEAINHGANKQQLALLREQFRIADKTNNPLQPDHIEIADGIPS